MPSSTAPRTAPAQQQDPGSSGVGMGTAAAYSDPSRRLRRHLARSATRAAILVSLDIAAILLGRATFRAVWSGALGAPLADVTIAFLPPTAVSGVELVVAMVAGLFLAGCYQAGEMWRDPVHILTGSAMAVAVVFYHGLWTGPVGLTVARALWVWGSIGVALVVERNAAFLLSRRLPRPGLVHRVLEVRGLSKGPVIEDLGPRYAVVASVSSEDVPDRLEDMGAWLPAGVDTILVAGEMPSEEFGRLADFALATGCQLLTLPRAFELVAMDPRRIWISGVPLFELTAPGLRASQLVVKRAMDVVVGGTMLLLLSPVLAVVAVLVRLDSSGPVVFGQMRPGFGGRQFRVYKFRTMYADAEERLRADPALMDEFLANGCKIPAERDPRITRVGRILRRWSLDELPQLINVLKGDMSLVGPRPLVGPELENYGGRILTLLSVKPGLTGLWQIRGRSNVGFPERAELDLTYVRRWSLVQDLWILLMTIPAVLLRRGAY